MKVFFEILFNRPSLCYFALSTTGAAFYKDFFIVLLLKIFKVKIVFHLHNKGINKAAKNIINKYIYKFVFANTNVILLSPKLYVDIERFISIRHVFIVPNGVPDFNGMYTFKNYRNKI